MKKLFSIIAVIAFVGVLSAPVFATNNVNSAIVQVLDDEPKKEETKKADKKAKKAKATKDCSSKCEKTCGDKDKK